MHFHDGTGIADGAILTRHILNANVTNAKLSTTEGELGGAWKAWTPTITGFSSIPPSGIYRYTRIGNTVHLYVVQNISGTSNSTSFTISLPVPAIAGSAALGLMACVDNSVDTVGIALLAAADNTVASLYKGTSGLASWTASGGKRTKFSLTYETSSALL